MTAIIDAKGLAGALRTLKLSGMLGTLEARLAQARAGDLGHLEFLRVLCEDEISRRAGTAIGRRLRRAASTSSPPSRASTSPPAPASPPPRSATSRPCATLTASASGRAGASRKRRPARPATWSHRRRDEIDAHIRARSPNICVCRGVRPIRPWHADKPDMCARNGRAGSRASSLFGGSRARCSRRRSAGCMGPRVGPSRRRSGRLPGPEPLGRGDAVWSPR
jgi:hypothetical protein